MCAKTSIFHIHLYIHSMTLMASNPRMDHEVPSSHIHSSHLSLCTLSMINDSPPSELPTTGLADFPPSLNLETNIPKQEDEGESFAVQASRDRRVHDIVSDLFSHPSSLGSSQQRRCHHQGFCRQTIQQKPAYS